MAALTHVPRSTDAAATRQRPIGIFWDIENCQVPKGKSATAVVCCIREHIMDSYTEEEFLCVCDIRKESDEVIQELNMAQVTVVHVNATCKNAADDKLKQCMRRFVDTHGAQATVVLITGDVNFSTELFDFRYRRKVRVILVYGLQAPEALTVYAHQCCSYADLVDTLPFRTPKKPNQNKFCDVVVNGLPEGKDSSLLHSRLRQLSDNCGGRVLSIMGQTAILRFSTLDYARRACKRMDGEDVFGSKISVSLPMCRNGRKQPFHVGQSAVGDRTSTVPRPRRQSISSSSTSSPTEALENRAVLQTRFSNSLQSIWDNAKEKIASSRKWDASFSGRDVPGDSLCKNVGRVSPFLLNGRKPKGRGSLTYPPNQASSIPASRAIRGPTLQLRMSASQTSSEEASHAPAMRPTRNGLPLRQRSGTLASSAESHPSSAAPVVLRVTNIDRCLEGMELKRLLLTLFGAHVTVLDVSIVLQQNGMLHGRVLVPAMKDAHLAMTKLHGMLIGRNNIKVVVLGYAPNHRANLLGERLVIVLRDAPQGSLPWFQLKELFQNRYNYSISLSEIRKFRDIVTVTDETSECMVVLNRNERSPSPLRGISLQPVDSSDSEHPEPLALGQTADWAQWHATPGMLPNVCIPLAVLGSQVHSLLGSHGGSLPLNSLLSCYEAEFEAIPRTTDEEPWYRGCVHLEHLVASLPGVQVNTAQSGSKTISWIEDGKNNKTALTGICSEASSSPLADPLEQLARDAVELLKMQPDSCITLHSFESAYRHYYGRECCTEDYGFCSILDLLLSLSDVLQVLGQGQNLLVTLTHRVQVKLFTTDILQVLTTQQDKMVKFTDLHEAFRRCHHRPLTITQYGCCYLEDMVNEATTSLLMVSRENETFITVGHKSASRKPSVDELERRRQFACEVVDMLKQSPDCSMPFDKFAPAYHCHFGRRCRAADYGCTKLTELFAAIPDVVQVVGKGDERQVKLSLPQRLQVEEERIAVTLDASFGDGLTLEQLEAAYNSRHGFTLQWKQFGADSLRSFLQSWENVIQVEDSGHLHLNSKTLQQEINCMASLLMKQPGGSMDLEVLWELHCFCYGTYPHASVLKHMEARQIASLEPIRGHVTLLPLHLVAHRIIAVLRQRDGQAPLRKLDKFFQERFGTPINPSGHNFENLKAMLCALPEYFTLTGHKRSLMVSLREAASASQDIQNCPRGNELLRMLRQPPADLLSDPIPSCVPSPELSAEVIDVPGAGDLMKFETQHEENTNLLDLEPASLETNSLSAHKNSTPPSTPSHLESTSSTPRRRRIVAMFPAGTQLDHIDFSC